MRRENYRAKKTVVSEYTTVPDKALTASYEVAYLVAQSKNPHTIAESLIRPAAVAMTRAMRCEKIAGTLETIPLSNEAHGQSKEKWKIFHCKRTNQRC